MGETSQLAATVGAHLVEESIVELVAKQDWREAHHSLVERQEERVPRELYATAVAGQVTRAGKEAHQSVVAANPQQTIARGGHLH